ncbi:hypothetical protein EDD86DRAFT_273469 [Gorgonomyces haynaldii]|nr:hypothetical protein EDD86DRAFT_273469 [Gorgonomyces haynaldii]
MSTGQLITRQVVREHLEEMGYAPEVLTDDILDEFVQDLEELYASGRFDDIELESDNKEQVIHSHGHSVVKNDYKSDRIGHLDISLLQNAVAQEMDEFDDTITEVSSQTSQRSFKAKQPGFIKVQPPKKPKKTDPVSRYHQHQMNWSKDGFLKRADKKQAPLHTGRWGGLVAPAPQQQRPRHNLAKKRTEYVVPTQKDRRDVIWEIRNRLALVHE